MRSLSASLSHFVFGDTSVGHRCLSSFPTRRSSDLSIESSSFLSEISSMATGPYRHLAITLVALLAAPAGRAFAQKGDAFEDRKSTRLNSSHRCISYAVFCLKKKTSHHAA